MAIIYLANVRISTEKAHGIQIMKMCEAFADAGMHVELVVPKRATPITDDPFSYYSVRKNFKIKRLSCLDLVRFGKVGFFIQVISFSISAFFYVLFKKYSIIYSRDELPLYFLSFFRRNIFWEAHTTKDNFIVRKLTKKCKKIISITKGLKDFYIKKYEIDDNKILVAPDGVDLADFDIKMSKEKIREEFELPKDKKIISYVGKYRTMGEGKGVSELIHAFPKILMSRSDAFLLLVGINEEEIDEVEKIFKILEINDDEYKIVTHIPRREVPYYLKASDVLIMNYPATEHYATYMSPLKLFEYMASGNVVVSSDLPSIREILNEKNAFLFKPDDKEALISGIISVLENNDLADKLSKQASLDVGRYTWEKRAEKILNFIK